MFTIRKEFHFSAAHQLDGLPDDHPCSRLHGHNYVVTFELKSPALNKNNFVKDYRELDAVKKFIDEILDHQNLNEVLTIPTTAERIAAFLYNAFKDDYPQLAAVEVKETEKTTARYDTSDF